MHPPFPRFPLLQNNPSIGIMSHSIVSVSWLVSGEITTWRENRCSRYVCRSDRSIDYDIALETDWPQCSYACSCTFPRPKHLLANLVTFQTLLPLPLSSRLFCSCCLVRLPSSHPHAVRLIRRSETLESRADHYHQIAEQTWWRLPIIRYINYQTSFFFLYSSLP